MSEKKSKEYDPKEIEPKWQEYWEKIGLYRTSNNPKKKYYILEMFPYPSGGDLHMGHLKNYAIGDVVARVKMMEGYDILHPMGWDAFGLPAENAALKHGIHPRDWTYNNIMAYREHLKLLGLSYDWEREIATCEPSYYKWTQWLFLILYDQGLAYRKSEYVNWCPNCNTVLANEQVVGGKCERCGTSVQKKRLEQWFFKITEYADRLIHDLKKLEGKWPPNVIKQQRAWIGRSLGTKIIFLLKGTGKKFPVFTTRADTIFGVTFLTIAPDHPEIEEILKLSPYRKEIEKYIEEAMKITETERTAEERPKTGIFTGLYLVHPFTGEDIPLWVGDYVLASYGTGIVMGVPGHDQRDFLFAKRYGLPIKVVIKPTDGEEPNPDTMEGAFEDYGVMVNSGEFDGLSSKEGIKRIEAKLEKMGLGGPSVSYRLRDWLISRQRYWGAPIPIVHCPKCGIVPVPKDELPVTLPEDIKDFWPKGRSPLENVTSFIETKCPRCGGDARRDPDTMDTFVDSSWYFLRFTDPKNGEEPFSKGRERTWMPVDQYVGGAEHATKHLIYARFIQKVLYDLGYTEHDEPFEHLFTQGLVLMKTKEGTLEMMSKSKGNVVPVGPFVKEYGADVARITILFAAPPEKDFEWTQEGVLGAKRFLQRVYRLYVNHGESIKNRHLFDKGKLTSRGKSLFIKYNQTVQGVKIDTKELHFNTALAKIMELVNALYIYPEKNSALFGWILHKLILLLAPFAPHFAEELWHMAGERESVFKHRFPEYDEDFLIGEEIEIPVQVNGKLRGRVKVPRDSTREVVERAARMEENIQKYLKDREIIRVIYVEGKLINFVVR